MVGGGRREEPTARGQTCRSTGQYLDDFVLADVVVRELAHDGVQKACGNSSCSCDASISQRMGACNFCERGNGNYRLSKKALDLASELDAE